MGSADLDDVLERLSLGLHSVVQLMQGGKQRGVNLGNGGNVHGSRETSEIEREFEYT